METVGDHWYDWPKSDGSLVQCVPRGVAGGGFAGNSVADRLQRSWTGNDASTGRQTVWLPVRVRLRNCSNWLEKNKRSRNMGPPTWDPAWISLSGALGFP